MLFNIFLLPFNLLVYYVGKANPCLHRAPASRPFEPRAGLNLPQLLQCCRQVTVCIMTNYMQFLCVLIDSKIQVGAFIEWNLHTVLVLKTLHGDPKTVWGIAIILTFHVHVQFLESMRALNAKMFPFETPPHPKKNKK